MSERDASGPSIDEPLSALLDGELDPAQERALRARIAAEPRLALRLAELEGVDAAVRELPAPEVPTDLRARLAARIAAEADNRMGETPRHYPGGLATRSRVRWVAGAALAAGLAVYLAVGGSDRPTPGNPPDPESIAALPAQDPPREDGGEPVGPVEPRVPSETPVEIAEASAIPTAEELATSLPDEDIAIALEYDALWDFELIDQLELLEVLAAAQEAPTSG